MMKLILPTLMLCVALTGCAGMQARQQQQANLNYCNGLSPWLKQAQCLDRVVSNDNTGLFSDQGSQELISYRRLLIENVTSHKMTDTEANYAFQQKIGEMNQRLAQARALNQISQPAPQTLQQTPSHQTLIYQRPVNSICQQIGSQVSCQSNQGGVAPLDTSALDPGSFKSFGN